MSRNSYIRTAFDQWVCCGPQESIESVGVLAKAIALGLNPNLLVSHGCCWIVSFLSPGWAPGSRNLREIAEIKYWNLSQSTIRKSSCRTGLIFTPKKMTGQIWLIIGGSDAMRLGPRKYWKTRKWEKSFSALKSARKTSNGIAWIYWSGPVWIILCKRRGWSLKWALVRQVCSWTDN